jgi:hypothetical protein
VQHPPEKLPEKYKALARLAGNANKDRKNYILGLLRDRWEFLYGDAHGVCWLLDPRYVYLDHPIERRHQSDLEKYISNFPAADGTTCETRELCFVHRVRYFWTASAPVTRCCTAPSPQSSRQPLPRSSGRSTSSGSPCCRCWRRTYSAERNFSDLAFIHSKLRNRLSTTKVAKMCFLRNNSKALNSMESSDAAVVTAPPVQESDGDGESEIQSVHDAEDINSADDFDFQESEGEQEQDEDEAA